MALLRFDNDWSRQKTFKSILLFFVHFLILIGIMAVLLLGAQLRNLSNHMREFGASYLYALFCVLLLVVIMYLYFAFELLAGRKAIVCHKRHLYADGIHFGYELHRIQCRC